MSAFQTLVIGGGAAGMMAAVSAARLGEKVVLLEGNPRLGRKILISGNGRCNLTNVDADSPRHYHGGNPRFVRPALKKYPLRQTLGFFADLGIETREEKRGRLFPLSDQAGSVVEVLEDCLKVLGVEVVRGAKVTFLERMEEFHVGSGDGRRWKAERIIMASGGSSASRLGADRSGLELAVGLGHSCTSLYPGLVPLVSPDPYVRRMQGVKVRAEVSTTLSERLTIVDTDDLLLTRYGVSGFTILNLSVQLVPLLAEGPREIQVNLFPGKSSEQVSEMLKERWQKNPHRSLEMSFAGLLSSKLVHPFLERFDLPGQRRVDQLAKAQRWHLARALTNWPIMVTQPRPFDYAEVTIGGIHTAEIDADSLESYLVPGLYFAGEVVDVHGDLGGFNFQWAWSSGYVAGQRGGS